MDSNSRSPESVSGRRVLALIAIARGHRRLPCRTSPGRAGSTSEAHGLQISRIPPRAPFPNGIARGRRCRLRSKFAADLYGAFPVKRLFWVVLRVFCSERERPFFVPSPAIRSPERAEGGKGPKR